LGRKLPPCLLVLGLSGGQHRIVVPSPGEPQLAFWMRQRPRPDCFVYVLRPEGHTAIKVGKAINVHQRIGDLQTGHPRRLELRAVLVGGFDLERELHYELWSHREQGEWFDGPPIDPWLDEIDRIAAEMYRTYRVTKRLPRWRDFPPWNVSQVEQIGAIRAEQLGRVGRLSSAQRHKAPSAAETRIAEARRRHKEEFAWIMAGEPS
jgi:T5orf172 domain